MGASSQPLSMPMCLEEELCKLTIRNGTAARGGWRLRSCGASRVSMKRRVRSRSRARLEGSRRTGSGIQRRVKTLKNLIPSSEPRGLDGLFRDTADYIQALQMKVRVMQVLVKALSSAGDDEGLNQL